ncbi:hypothetical protein ABLE93_00430 [Xanthobacter sp. KR7-65]
MLKNPMPAESAAAGLHALRAIHTVLIRDPPLGLIAGLGARRRGVLI